MAQVLCRISCFLVLLVVLISPTQAIAKESKLHIPQDRVEPGKYSDLSVLPLADQDCLPEEQGPSQEPHLYTDTHFEKNPGFIQEPQGEVTNPSFFGKIWSAVKRGIIGFFDFIFRVFNRPQEMETSDSSNSGDTFTNRYKGNIDRHKQETTPPTEPTKPESQVTVLNTRSVSVPPGSRGSTGATSGRVVAGGGRRGGG